MTGIPSTFVENGDVIIYRGDNLLMLNAAQEALTKAGVNATIWWVEPRRRLRVGNDEELQGILTRYGVPGECGHLRTTNGPCTECRHRNQFPKE